MKHMKFLTFFFCIAFAVFACSSNNETDPNAGGLPDKEEPLTTDFAKGADIGWCTEYESKGYDFYNAKGEKRECTALMKELGLSNKKHTTDDMLFTVETVSCLGACGLAPTLTVNDEVHPKMTPEKAIELLNELRGESV